MTKEITHALILVFTVVIAFVFPKTNLAQYDLQISAGLFILLYLTRNFFVSKNIYSRLIESVIFTLVIMGIINSTGGIESPFFFLTHFLLEPIIPITTTVTIIIFYLLELPPNQGFRTLMPIISLAFVTPFAMFLGQEKVESEKLKVKTEKTKENTFLFLSLILKNHLKNIREAAQNFVGDHQLEIIKKSTHQMEKQIEKFEKGD